MIDYIYEVRGVNDPIDGDTVKFSNKQEACNFAYKISGAKVYMVEVDTDYDWGISTPTGKEWCISDETELEDGMNSCSGDDSANYDEDGNFRAPALEDDLEEGIAEDHPTVINTPAEANKGELLISAIKTAVIDFKTLHRNLTGGNWFTIHELVGEWYEKLDEFEDAIVENLISIGCKDTGVAATLDPRDFTEEEVLNFAQNAFANIKALSVATREELAIPTALCPVFDELEQFCQIEGDYKISHYFADHVAPEETAGAETLVAEDEEFDEAFFEAVGAAIKAKRESLVEGTESDWKIWNCYDSEGHIGYVEGRNESEAISKAKEQFDIDNVEVEEGDFAVDEFDHNDYYVLFPNYTSQHFGEGFDDRRGHDPIDRRERTELVTEKLIDDLDIDDTFNERECNFVVFDFDGEEVTKVFEGTYDGYEAYKESAQEDVGFWAPTDAFLIAFAEGPFRNGEYHEAVWEYNTAKLDEFIGVDIPLPEKYDKIASEYFANLYK